MFFLSQEDLKGWVNSINASLKEIEDISKWEKATNSSTDPDKSERKERSEGAEPSEGAERSERSDRSDKIEASDKSSEKRDASEKESGERGERAERGERGSRGSSISGKSKWLISPHVYLLIHPSIFPETRQDPCFSVSVSLFVLTAWFQDGRVPRRCVSVCVPMCSRERIC